MPQGAPLRRPTRCIALRPARVTQLRRCLHHLLLKKAPWLLGVRPLGETHRVRRLHSKKGAAKKSLAPKKVLACSPHRCARIVFLL